MFWGVTIFDGISYKIYIEDGVWKGDKTVTTRGYFP